MDESKKSILILFTPAIIINLILSLLLPFVFVPRSLWQTNYNAAMEQYMVLMYSTGMILWPVFQVIFGVFAYKSLRKRGFSNEDIFGFAYFKTNVVKSIGIVVLLIVICELLFYSESLITATLSSMTMEEYYAQFLNIVQQIPYSLRVMTFIVGPFTAGIGEELFFRGYGITELERSGKTKIKANLIQALAFGVWHGFSLHAVITFVIGFIFGYIYIRGEKHTLASLIITHWILDFYGFLVYI